MGNQASNNAEESDEEYQVLNISYQDLQQFQNVIKTDNLDQFQEILPKTKTVDTDAYLEFTDALIAMENDTIYTLKGKRNTTPGRDPFEELIDSGYVISMLEFAQEQKAKKISGWLEEAIQKEQFAKDLSANPLPDLYNLLPEDYPGLPENIHAIKCDSPDILRIPSFSEHIPKGGVMYWYGGVSGETTPKMKAKIKALINMSDFDDETKENGVPHIDCDDPSSFGKYTFIITINAKLTPVKDASLVNLGILTDPEYHEYLQSTKSDSTKTKILRYGENGWMPRNPRTVRSVAKLFGGMKTTIQLQFSECDIDEINKLTALTDGVEWTKAFLTERTKQNIKNKDSTAKLKTIVLVKQLKHGTLLYAISITANTLVPAWVVNMAQGKAVSKLVETAKGSRQYYVDKFPGGVAPEGYVPRVPKLPTK